LTFPLGQGRLSEYAANPPSARQEEDTDE
jgi:hypothetical protein